MNKLTDPRLFKTHIPHIYIYTKSCPPEYVNKNIPNSQFLRLNKICLDTSDCIKKSNEYLNFFMKQG